MSKRIESGNNLDAAPKGPRLPGKKKMPPMPKQEPAAAPATTPAPVPETPVSAVREIKEITLSTAAPEENPDEAAKQARIKIDHAEAAVVVVKHKIEERRAAPAIELTLEAPPPPPPPPPAAQLAEAVGELTEEMRKQREAGNLLPIASVSDPVIELTLEAPPPSPEEPPARMMSADTLLPKAEAIAANKDEETFFARGEKMGQRSALRPRLRRTIITHNYVTVAQPQPEPQETGMARNTDTTNTPTPETPPPPDSSKGFRALGPAAEETNDDARAKTKRFRPLDKPATETPAAKPEEEKKSHVYMWWIALVAVGVAMFFIGRCTVSTSSSNETTVVTTDTTANATHTASAKPSATPTTSAVAPATTAKATTSEQPVSIQRHGRMKATNELLAEVAAANGGKWSGTTECWTTDWTPESDTSPWVDCSSQKKKDLAGPKPNCFKVEKCEIVFDGD